MDEHHRFVVQVPVVVNQNTEEVLVVSEIPLSPPAFKIDRIEKKVVIDDSIASQVAVKEAGKTLITFQMASRYHSLIEFPR